MLCKSCGKKWNLDDQLGVEGSPPGIVFFLAIILTVLGILLFVVGVDGLAPLMLLIVGMFLGGVSLLFWLIVLLPPVGSSRGPVCPHCGKWHWIWPWTF